MSFGYQVLGFGSGGAGSPYLVKDEFTDADSTALASHTPNVDTVGGGWSEVLNALEIGSNSVTNVSSTPGNNGIGVIQTNASDVTIEAKLKVGSSSPYFSWLCIVYRYVDNNNFWMGQLVGTTNGNLDSYSINIDEVNAGVQTTRASQSITMSAHDVFYDGTLVANGTSHSWTLDGNEITYTSSLHQTNTKHGVYIDDTDRGQDYIDDFRVTAL